MAYDNRKKFWFGTESYADWFATPLAGADSSPSAWGADGTLLNGGGWALNSWGSHKRYTYEWPASSSRETAQRMKSYRDGTYGRGLLYFLEPTIFTTNVLPAHWADPSMSLDNEAPSLVYGVDPTPVATSGGANLGLPITSAQYDLSNVTPQSIPTPDSSVFIPIPTGHTLFLGAFYSSTGTGGVFATPVNGNGTLGTAVKLTEKSNSDTDVVTDQFSGDLRGVRLWVGRSDATASTVTIAGMAGRLLETSGVVTYGPWVERRRNRYVAAGIGLSTIAAGTSSVIINTGLYSGGYAPVTPGETLSFAKFGVMGNRFQYGFTSTLPVASTPVSSAANAGNEATAVTEVIVPSGATYLVLYMSNINPETRGFVTLSGPDALDRLFDGSTPATLTEQFRWLGVAGASESVYETRVQMGNPAKQNKLSSGPWLGGQGHSGCRFLGAPSYVTNSPIEGGRIGFAASFVEVGSWIYG